LVAIVVLDVRAGQPGGQLRAQRQRALRAIGEGVHLLADDVGALADAAHEQLGVLDHRRPGLEVAVAGEQLAAGALEVLPLRRVRR
jgi:hypothetical protein